MHFSLDHNLSTEKLYSFVSVTAILSKNAMSRICLSKTYVL